IFGYYFRDKYQSFFVHGRFNPKTREVIIQNIPIIYFNSNSTVNSIDCNTNFVGVIINSRAKSTLKGAFYHDEKYKYMCPDLKVVYTLDKDEKPQPDKQQEVTNAAPKMWKPQADDYVVDAVKTDHPADTPKTARIDTPAVVKMDTATVARIDTLTVVKTDTPLTAITAPIADRAAEESKVIKESFSQRKEVITKVLDVESDSVRLSFYDNGEIDGDSISIFVNDEVVLTHQGLAAKALTMYLHLDSTREVNEIGMFAENLGKFPPNTALMVVTDGKNRYEVFMSSSLTENAIIQIRRKKSP
ncbi:MAG TPA: hypothetical protein VHD83_22875, partial [Puia sp.]|nr:hypothetical protein [Puia sp.]